MDDRDTHQQMCTGMHKSALKNDYKIVCKKRKRENMFNLALKIYLKICFLRLSEGYHFFLVMWGYKMVAE